MLVLGLVFTVPVVLGSMAILAVVGGTAAYADYRLRKRWPGRNRTVLLAATAAGALVLVPLGVTRSARLPDRPLRHAMEVDALKKNLEARNPKAKRTLRVQNRFSDIGPRERESNPRRLAADKEALKRELIDLGYTVREVDAAALKPMFGPDATQRRPAGCAAPPAPPGGAFGMISVFD